MSTVLSNKKLKFQVEALKGDIKLYGEAIVIENSLLLESFNGQVLPKDVDGNNPSSVIGSFWCNANESSLSQSISVPEEYMNDVCASIAETIQDIKNQLAA